MLPIANSNNQSAFAETSTFANAMVDETADKLGIGNIGTGNISTLATFSTLFLARILLIFT